MKIHFLIFLSSLFFTPSWAFATEVCDFKLLAFKTGHAHETIDADAQQKMLTVLSTLKSLREDDPSKLITFSESEVYYALNIFISFEGYVAQFISVFGLSETALGSTLWANVSLSNASPFVEQLRKLNQDYQSAHAQLQLEESGKALRADARSEASRAALETLIREISEMRPRFARRSDPASSLLLDQIEEKLFGENAYPEASDQVNDLLNRLRVMQAHLRARGPQLVSTETRARPQ